ncbi:TPA: hypothetical protein KML24_004378 [Escherichia coli]|nr:hypothetical protein [Escherichia coli]HBE6508698.1 hypothetical protein [Escherichia coli]
MEIILALIGIALMAIFSFVTYKNKECITEHGRPIKALIVHARPVGADELGNTTVEYILSFEDKRLVGREKVSTFYAPQFQTGETIEIIYVNDKKYIFSFK